MKSAPFAYERVDSVAAAATLLRRHGDEARLIAGGQTLLATLAMRLSQPALLIDITDIAEMRGIAVVEGRLRIGALERHVDIERSALVAQTLPLLSLAAPHIAHAAIRNRGTIGGSIAFADPAAEWPACAVAADADIILSDGEQRRRVSAAEFFIDLYQTALRPAEIITAIEFPLPPSSRRFAFAELARRHGDYAMIGLALAAELTAGKLNDLRIVYFGAGNIPVRAFAAERALAGSGGETERLDRALLGLAEDLHPTGDLTVSPATKRHLAGVLLRRQIAALLTGTHRDE